VERVLRAVPLQKRAKEQPRPAMLAVARGCGPRRSRDKLWKKMGTNNSVVGFKLPARWFRLGWFHGLIKLKPNCKRD
jgi:hypothetical protein